MRAEAVWRANSPGVSELVEQLLDSSRSRDGLLANPAVTQLQGALERSDGLLAESAVQLDSFVLIAPDGFVAAATDRTLVGEALGLHQGSALRSAMDGQVGLRPLPRGSGEPGPTALAARNGSELLVAVPVRGRSGDVIGALGFRLNSNTNLKNLLRQGRLGRTGRTDAYSGNREWLTDHGPELPLLDPANIPRYPVFDGLPYAAAGRDGKIVPGLAKVTVDISGYRGRFGSQVVGAWCLLPELGIGLATEMDFQEAFQPLHQLQQLMVSFNVIVALVIVLLVAVSRYPGHRQAEDPIRRLKKSFAPWAILAVSMLATVLLWHITQTRVNEFDQARFDQKVERFRRRLLERMDYHADMSRSIQAALQSFGVRGKRDWSRFIQALSLHDSASVEYVGFIERVPSDQLGAFEQALSADYQGDYHVYPGGSGMDSLPIRHVEPMPLNAGRLGFDLGSVPDLRRLAERARDSGSVSMGYVGPGWLLDEDEPGILCLASVYTAPVYAAEAKAGSVEERRSTLRGWVSTLIPAAVILGELTDEGSIGVDLEVFAGDEVDPVQLIYDRDGVLDAGKEGYRVKRRHVESIQLGDATWTLSFAANSEFEPASWENQPAQVLLGGFAMSVLLFDIGLVLSSTRSSALAMAELMTKRVRESEARIRGVIDQAPDGIITFDKLGVVETFNPGAERLFGYPAQDASGRRIDELMPACVEYEPGHNAPAKIIKDPSNGGREITGKRKDGTSFPIELTISQMELDDRRMFTAIVRDISERKGAEEALRESEQRYALAARAVNDGLWDWNLLTEEIYYSPRWKVGLGYSESEIECRTKEWFSRVHPEDLPQLLSQLENHVEGKTIQFECEHRVLHRDGAYRWMLSRGAAVRDESGKAIRLAGSQTDITARKRAENQLLHDALHDPLTALPNRTYFMRRLETASRRATRNDEGLFAVLFLDVDRFKVVNDSLGHVVGDQLLVGIAHRLRTLVRPDDVVARLGGDEFAILLEDIANESLATQIADRLQKELSEPFIVGDQEVFTAASIGIAFGTGDQETAVELIRNADTAMYRAKSLGRARYEKFDQVMHLYAVELLQLETDLRRALDREEFLLYYQPIVSLQTLQVTSCEALIRWRHPERGMVLPGEFIPVAEDTGLIIPMSAWVLRTACEQAKAWKEAGLEIPISVNISPRHIKHEDLHEAITAILDETGLDPRLLRIELTESALMENADSTIKPLYRLYSKGVEISLDDFGTGYSSLTYLRRFPISTLKIDESFIREIATDPSDAAICSGVIALAHSLGLNVVFEGVETESQLAFLRQKACDEVQGRAICAPLPAEGCLQFIRENSAKTRLEKIS